MKTIKPEDMFLYCKNRNDETGYCILEQTRINNGYKSKAICGDCSGFIKR